MGAEDRKPNKEQGAIFSYNMHSITAALTKRQGATG